MHRVSVDYASNNFYVGVHACSLSKEKWLDVAVVAVSQYRFLDLPFQDLLKIVEHSLDPHQMLVPWHDFRSSKR